MMLVSAITITIVLLTGTIIGEETETAAPFVFDRLCKDGCRFANQPRQYALGCAGNSDNYDERKCHCDGVYIADSDHPVWYPYRSYFGSMNCSVGQFGPCGHEVGLKVGCHDPGVSCVQGKCINPTKPKESVNGRCESTDGCEQNLVCSHYYHICIKKKSLGERNSCLAEIECSQELTCIATERSFGGESRELYCELKSRIGERCVRDENCEPKLTCSPVNTAEAFKEEYFGRCRDNNGTSGASPTYVVLVLLLVLLTLVKVKVTTGR